MLLLMQEFSDFLKGLLVCNRNIRLINLIQIRLRNWMMFVCVCFRMLLLRSLLIFKSIITVIIDKIMWVFTDIHLLMVFIYRTD